MTTKGVYRRGRIWWVRYAAPDGEIIRESTRQGERRVADRIYRERKRAVATGTWVHPKQRGDGGRVTVADYAERWLTKREGKRLRNSRCEDQKLRDHVLPLIGSDALEDLRPKDAVRLVEELCQRERLDGRGLLAPRTVRQCYDLFRQMCRDAVVDEVIIATPCVLPGGTLPAKRDKVPGWRATAVFSRDEVERLISDEVVPWDRRVLYALQFFFGVRHGEAAGRRWEHYDAAAKPLGRMWIATQYDDQPLKAGTPREVPVHPVLAAMLAEWKLRGFPLFFGRQATPRDFIVPETDAVQHGRIGQHRLDGTSLRRLHRDLEALGFRARRQHDARRTLVSLGRADGCNPDVLKACTHGSAKELLDDYTTWPWETKCAEIAKLRIKRRGVAPVDEVHSQGHSGTSDAAEAL